MEQTETIMDLIGVMVRDIGLGCIWRKASAAEVIANLRRKVEAGGTFEWHMTGSEDVRINIDILGNEDWVEVTERATQYVASETERLTGGMERFFAGKCEVTGRPLQDWETGILSNQLIRDIGGWSAVTRMPANEAVAEVRRQAEANPERRWEVEEDDYTNSGNLNLLTAADWECVTRKAKIVSALETERLFSADCWFADGETSCAV